jgi:hypothetical protein
MIPAESFLSTLYMNVDNERLTDAAFRELVRNTMDIVDFPRPIVECRFCEFEYDRKLNPCGAGLGEDCSMTSCPMCSSCQSNEATAEFVKGARFRRWVAEGGNTELVLAPKGCNADGA